MSQENQSCLRFSLEETLWFRKGQEVDELVSISLDPDITIQENDQYVTIRGSLELTGEYNSSNENNAAEEEIQTTHKYVQAVEERDGGTCDFSHHFPVDITIPNNRIQSIYDIDVSVESFDYTLPERSCLKLSAELTISGLYGVGQNDSFEDSQILEALNRNEEESKVDGSAPIFAVEARKQQEETNFVPEKIEIPTFSYQEVRNEEIEEELVIEEPGEVEQEEVVVVVESSSSSKEESSPKQEEVKKKKAHKKNSMSLTEFFARKEETEEQVKIKICIVQKGDTLDLLAERYDVTIQNLLRANQLEINQDVQEGQVLYIPVALQKR